MTDGIVDFLIHWGIMSLSLWVASQLFSGVTFKTQSSLILSALLLGLVNALLRPILFWLTFPITIVTLGFFALALNAFMIMFVAKLVSGFDISGFWKAFFVSIFIALFTMLIEQFLPSQGVALQPIATGSTIMI